MGALGVTERPAAPAERHPRPRVRASGGNVVGRARALTLLTPVRPAMTGLLRAIMRTANWHPLFHRHSMQFKFIYFVRWAIFRELGAGGPDRPPHRLRYAYLYFESNFDTPWKQYIDAFAYVIPRDIRVIWGRGPAFPGPPPAEPLKRWIARNSMEGGHYYAAYPEASVKMVLSGLRVRRRAAALARRSDGMTPGQFRVEFARLVDDLQRDL